MFFQVKEYSRTKNSLLNFMSGMGCQFMTLFLRFFVRTIFIYTLGKEYLGIDGLFSNIISMLSLTELGFGAAIGFRLYKPLAEKDETRIRILIKFFKKAYIVIGWAILIIGLLIVPLLPILIKDYSHLLDLKINVPLLFIIYLMQSVSTYWFFTYTTIIINASQKTYILYGITIFNDIAKSLIQIAILLIWKDFLLYVLAVVVYNFFGGWINAYIAHKLFPFAFRKESKKMERSEIKDIFKDCGALFLNKMNGVTLKVCDNFVLSSFIGIVIVGIYSNYVILLSAIGGIVSKFYRSMMASIGNLYATSSVSKSYGFFEVLNFSSIVLYGTVCAVVFLLFDDIIFAWLGKEYVIAQPCALLMGIEMVVSGLKGNLGQVRSATGAFRQKWFRPVMGIIINVAVSIALVKPFGICGVLAGTIIADVTTVLAVDPFVIHKYSFKRYKPTWYYYKKNITYLLVLSLLILGDYFICNLVKTNVLILDVVLHGMICCITIPVTFFFIYRNADYVLYIKLKGLGLIRIFNRK